MYSYIFFQDYTTKVRFSIVLLENGVGVLQVGTVYFVGLRVRHVRHPNFEDAESLFRRQRESRHLLDEGLVAA